MKHGGAGYTRGCRCTDCRRAHAEYQARWRARKHGQPAPDTSEYQPRKPPEPPTHTTGTRRNHRIGTNCLICHRPYHQHNPTDTPCWRL